MDLPFRCAVGLYKAQIQFCNCKTFFWGGAADSNMYRFKKKKKEKKVG